MSFSKSQSYKRLCTTVDLLSIIAAWISAYFMRFYGPLPIPKGIPEWHIYYKLIPFLAIIWILISTFTSYYKHLSEFDGFPKQILGILKNFFLFLPTFIAVTYFYEEYKFSRITFFIFSIFAPFFIILGRSSINSLIRFYQSSTPTRRILLIGGGDALKQGIASVKFLGLKPREILGAILISDPQDKEASSYFLKTQKINIFEFPENWSDFFSIYPCDTALICLPYTAYGFIEQHLDAIANQIADIKLLPDIAKYTRFSTGIDIINNVPVISIHESPLVGVGSWLKRGLDIIGSLCAIIIFSPLMLICSFFVKLSSAGPIIYKQDRMGLDGRIFSIYKFRSMSINAEATSGAVWAKKQDSRPTKIGRIMRKTSLDELPQLFNVLKGNMSLVGPRPERPLFVQQFRKQVPGYMLRHKAKAGMTGWAQVNGWRGDTSIEKRIEFDLFYIQHWSLSFDLKILFLTIFKGFTNPNAY